MVALTGLVVAEVEFPFGSREHAVYPHPHRLGKRSDSTTTRTDLRILLYTAGQVSGESSHQLSALGFNASGAPGYPSLRQEIRASPGLGLSRSTSEAQARQSQQTCLAGTVVVIDHQQICRTP